jgi:hypothetical protein
MPKFTLNLQSFTSERFAAGKLLTSLVYSEIEMNDDSDLDFWESPDLLEDDLDLTFCPLGSPEASPSPDLNPASSGIPGNAGHWSMGVVHKEPEIQTFQTKTKKGRGPESKVHAPDPHDCYDFQNCSPSYARIMFLGYQYCTLDDIVHIGGKVEDLLLSENKPITERNRAARRRKANAFHWIDENWAEIAPEMYDSSVLAVLGDPEIPRTRRRHGVKP